MLHTPQSTLSTAFCKVGLYLLLAYFLCVFDVIVAVAIVTSLHCVRFGNRELSSSVQL